MKLLTLLAIASLTPLQESLLDSEPKDGGAVLSRPGDGSPVCGLGAKFHAGRRAALLESLGEGAHGVIVLRGLPESAGYTEFHQDKTFWYLTGIESPGASVLIDVASGDETLFLPPSNARKEIWEGELWDAGDAWVRELTGFENVRSNREMVKALGEALERGGGKAWISTQPAVTLGGCFDRAEPAGRRQEGDPLDGRVSREDALAQNLEEDFGAEVGDLRPHLDGLRLIKTEEEIDAMRRASRSGVVAMEEAIRSTHAGLGEWDLDALMSFVQVRHGATGPAYYAIVGSGHNSCTLHYNASARRMEDGEVLLIDYGPEVDHYTTDITRTWPVNGRYSERQAELYDYVLEAQQAAIDVVKPGITLGDVNAAARAVLERHKVAHLLPHGVSHWIGMEVHDVGDYSRVLEPGMAFTVEPGLYEPATGIGIRIEDVVVVTADGCENLTQGVPRDRAAIERLMAQKGLLEIGQVE